MAENGSELSDRQRKAIAALMAARSVPEAAQAASVGERTLYRWLADDDVFRAALTAAEDRAIDTAARRLVQAAGDSVDVLITIRDDPEAPAAVRGRMAQILLDNLLRLRELRDVEARLSALEATIGKQGD
jgi:hypothetical protein